MNSELTIRNVFLDASGVILDEHEHEHELACAAAVTKPDLRYFEHVPKRAGIVAHAITS